MSFEIMHGSFFIGLNYAPIDDRRYSDLRSSLGFLASSFASSRRPCLYDRSIGINDQGSILCRHDDDDDVV